MRVPRAVHPPPPTAKNAPFRIPEIGAGPQPHGTVPSSHESVPSALPSWVQRCSMIFTVPTLATAPLALLPANACWADPCHPPDVPSGQRREHPEGGPGGSVVVVVTVLTVVEVVVVPMVVVLAGRTVVVVVAFDPPRRFLTSGVPSPVTRS